MAAFDLATGQPLFWFQAAGPIPGSPAVVDGVLLFASDTRTADRTRQVGYFYALALP